MLSITIVIQVVFIVKRMKGVVSKDSVLNSFRVSQIRPREVKGGSKPTLIVLIFARTRMSLQCWCIEPKKSQHILKGFSIIANR